ncbi:hypothetical protein [Paenibacillus sp. FSL M7-0896]|uniref:hypothetical protein n=1 Tax=Paenibacillus sp. FSL M7-0896 TaxID=2921610 RepID=UPI0030DA4CD4
MTPERLKAIKNMMEEEYARPDSPYSGRFVANAPYAIADLLAALEETQQQNNRLEVKLQASRDSVYPLSVERDEYKFELAEAQQTIARAIQIYETADMESDFDHVLTGMYETLKGGETQP